jgi:triphosphoribosyl-dephospho-CoA synthase
MGGVGVTPEEVAKAVELACMAEVLAPKPGNVNRYRDFTDTSCEDFLLSAWSVGPVFARAGNLSVGELVYRARRAVRQFVAANTNLGIILLTAPLAKAALLPAGLPLRERVQEVLAGLTVADSKWVFAAIREAGAGGLGKVDRQDIGGEPTLPLGEAMDLARERDTIAAEYCTGFHHTFTTGYPALVEALEFLPDWRQAVVQAFLVILAALPDTLIARKVGWERAREVSRRAQAVLAAGGLATTGGRRALADFDAYLRREGNRLNPGTTADLTAASLLVLFLEEGYDRFFGGGKHCDLGK